MLDPGNGVTSFLAPPVKRRCYTPMACQLIPVHELRSDWQVLSPHEVLLNCCLSIRLFTQVS